MSRNVSRTAQLVERGVDQAFAQVLVSGHRIILYGAGKIGQRLQAALRWFGRPAECFWDRNADILGFECDGTPIQVPDPAAATELERGNCVVLIAIFSENVAEQIRSQLNQAGYTQVVADRRLLNQLLHAECASRQAAGQFSFDLSRCQMCPVVSDARSRCDLFDDHVQRHFVLGLEQVPLLELVVPSMGVLVSNKCTMTCEGCNHLRDHYVSSDNRDIAPGVILNDLEKMLSAVDLVNKLVLVGGESLLHPQIESIVSRIMQLPRVGIIQVITNGTVVPKSRRLFELLASPRVIIEISDYGDHVPVQLRPNLERFVARLEEYGIHYRRIKTLQWFDFGGFEDRGYDAVSIRRVYETCCFVSHDLLDGRLYKCSRSAYGTAIGKVPDYPGDYVDIRGLDRTTLRHRLTEFLALDHVEACRHCNGASSTHVMEAGKQLIAVQKTVARPVESQLLTASAGIPAVRVGRRR